MDPNQCVRELVGLANNILNADGCKYDPSDTEDLAAMVINLDEWLRKGGFLPSCWEENRQAGWEIN